MDDESAPSLPLDPEHLLSHGPWMDRLARSLVRGSDVADDLQQDAWLVALETPPEDRDSLKPWLARVLSNLASQGRRREANRRAREVRAARDEGLPSAAETAERIEVHRRLIQALSELEEPLRSTVMLRYYDGLSSVEIARRQRVPDSTVRGRLMRGIARLRERLDENSGGREAWCVAMSASLRHAPTIAPAGATAGTTGIIGVLVMNTTARWLVASAVVALSSFGLWRVLRSEPVDGGGAVRAVVTEHGEPLESPGTPALASPDAKDATSARTVVDAIAASERASNSASGAPVTRLDARFVDVGGRPIADVRVESPRELGGRVVTSDDKGRVDFELEVEDGAQNLRIVTKRDGYADHVATVPVTIGQTKYMGDIVLDRGGSVSGVVLGPDGAPFRDAEIRVTKPDGILRDATLMRRGPFSIVDTSDVRTRADGSFRADGLPARTLVVSAGAPGMRWTTSEPIEVVGGALKAGVTLKLAPLAPEDSITGSVLDPSGTPIANARIEFVEYKDRNSTSSSTETNERGQFEIRVQDLWLHDITAHDPQGRWPAVMVQAVRPGTHDLVLQLAEPAKIRLSVSSSSRVALDGFAVDVSTATRGSFTHNVWSSPLSKHDGGVLDVPMPNVGFTIGVVAPGHDRRELGPFEPNSAPKYLDCLLQPIPGIQGVVSAQGRPVAGASLTIFRVVKPDEQIHVGGFASRFDPNEVDTATSDTDGRFHLTPRSAGTYAVLCEARGHALHETSDLAFDPTRPQPPLEIALIAGGTIEGRVVVADGVDPAGTVVSASRHDMHPRTTRVGHDGRFRFDGLTPGPWNVEHAKEEYMGALGWTMSSGKKPKPFPSNCNVLDGQVSRVDIDLTAEAPARFLGHVSVNGAVAKGFHVTIWPAGVTTSSGSLPSGIVDERGDVAIVVDRPGKYEVALSDGSALYARIPVTLVPGPNAWVRTFETGRVKGVVTDAKSRDATLVVLPQFEEGATCWVSAELALDGSFDMPHVPTGKATIRLQRGFGESTVVIVEKHVDVTRGGAVEVSLP